MNFTNQNKPALVAWGTKRGKQVFFHSNISAKDVYIDNNLIDARIPLSISQLNKVAYSIEMVEGAVSCTVYRTIYNWLNSYGFYALSIWVNNTTKFPFEQMPAILQEMSDLYYKNYVETNKTKKYQIVTHNENVKLFTDVLDKVNSSKGILPLMRTGKETAYCVYKTQDELQQYFNNINDEQLLDYKQIILLPEDVNNSRIVCNYEQKNIKFVAKKTKNSNIGFSKIKPENANKLAIVVRDENQKALDDIKLKITFGNNSEPTVLDMTTYKGRVELPDIKNKDKKLQIEYDGDKYQAFKQEFDADLSEPIEITLKSKQGQGKGKEQDSRDNEQETFSILIINNGSALQNKEVTIIAEDGDMPKTTDTKGRIYDLSLPKSHKEIVVEYEGNTKSSSIEQIKNGILTFNFNVKEDKPTSKSSDGKGKNEGKEKTEKSFLKSIFKRKKQENKLVKDGEDDKKEESKTFIEFIKNPIVWVGVAVVVAIVLIFSLLEPRKPNVAEQVNHEIEAVATNFNLQKEGHKISRSFYDSTVNFFDERKGLLNEQNAEHKKILNSIKILKKKVTQFYSNQVENDIIAFIKEIKFDTVQVDALLKEAENMIVEAKNQGISVTDIELAKKKLINFRKLCVIINKSENMLRSYPDINTDTVWKLNKNELMPWKSSKSLNKDQKEIVKKYSILLSRMNEAKKKKYPSIEQQLKLKHEDNLIKMLETITGE